LVPDAQSGMRAAVMQDLAIATEKSGGDVQAAVKMAQASADLFGTAKLFDAQVETLATLAGMQQRSNDATGSAKTLAAATTVQNEHRLFPVTVNVAAKTLVRSPLSASMRVADVTLRGTTETTGATALASTPLTANAQPRLVSSIYLGKLPPER